MKFSLFIISVFVSVIFISFSLNAQILHKNSFRLDESASVTSDRPLSNSVTDIVVSGDTLWVGTGKGLSLSTDRGTTWKNFYEDSTFGTEDISAIAIHNKEVWVATAHTVVVSDQSLPDGTGLRYSSDGGNTWTTIPQPVDDYNVDTLHYGKNLIPALGITTTIQNITYDIAVTDSAVWIASWAGIVRKTTDKGKTWERVILPPDNLNSISPDDSLSFDLSPSAGILGLSQNYNHVAFSLLAENNDTIWVGTADGINRTTDGGISWVKFNHQNENQPMSGDFVVALSLQKVGSTRMIWAATNNANDPTEVMGASFTSDDGQTWGTALVGGFVHAIGVKDSVVYVLSDNGIFRSQDFGTTWLQAGTIYDQTTKQQVTSSAFYAVAPQGDTVWFGGDDGLASTIDNSSTQFGIQWQMIRAYQAIGTQKTTYAYPNPFSPADEVVRLHYSTGGKQTAVTIRIFDFGMHLVRTVINKAFRSGTTEYDEIWNGKDDNNRQVSNGPYFYQVIIGNDNPIWGKILVLQ
jgi:hypothetical protein